MVDARAQMCKKMTQIVLKIKETILGSKQREDLIVIPPKLKDAILAKCENEIDKKDANEALKCALRNALDLHDRDVVVAMGDKLVVRIFNHDVVNQSQDSSSGGIEKRFNGLPPEELENIYAKLAKKINFQEEIKKIALEALNAELNIEKVNNFTFTPLFVKVFQTRIGNFLSAATNEEKFVIEGLVNFIFRKFFDQSLNIIADKYVNLMMSGNKQASDFIDFYNGDTISKPDGSKLQKPYFVDPKGTRINKVIILQLGMTYKKAAESFKFFTQKLKGFEHQIAEISSEIERLKKEIASSEGELTEAKEKADSSLTELKELKSKLIELKTKKASNDEIEPISNRIKQLSVEEDTLFKNRKRLEGEVERLKIKLLNSTKELEATQRVYEKEKPKSEQVKANFLESKKRYEDVISLVGMTISKFRG